MRAAFAVFAAFAAPNAIPKMLELVAAQVFRYFAAAEDLALQNATLVFQKSFVMFLPDGHAGFASAVELLGNGYSIYVNGGGGLLFQEFTGIMQDLTIIASNYSRYAVANRLEAARLINVRVICNAGKNAFGYSLGSVITGLYVQGDTHIEDKRVFENSVTQSNISGLLAPDFLLSQELSDSTANLVVVGKLGSRFTNNNVSGLFCLTESQDCNPVADSITMNVGQGDNLFQYQEASGNYTFSISIARPRCDENQLLLSSDCLDERCFKAGLVCSQKSDCVDLKCVECARPFCKETDARLALLILFACLFGVMTVTSVVLVGFLLKERAAKAPIRRVKRPIRSDVIRQKSLDLTLMESK